MAAELNNWKSTLTLLPFVPFLNTNAMKPLLTITAMIELGAALALLIIPSATSVFLVGEPLDLPAAVIVARVAGAALLALAVACWQARDDAHSRASRGLVSAMLIYNLGVAAVLEYAGLGQGMHGIALWPAVILHATMTGWCITCLLRNPKEHRLRQRDDLGNE